MNCVSVHALIIPHKFFTAKDLCGIILYILRKGSKNGFMLDNNSAYINRSEELRLLGYGNKAPDGAVADILEECEKEIAAVAVPKYIFAEFETASAPIKLAGKSIAAHICECDRIILFAATLGGGVDALGVNCALGPNQLSEIVADFLKWSHIPVIVKANAGLPSKYPLILKERFKNLLDINQIRHPRCMEYTGLLSIVFIYIVPSTGRKVTLPYNALPLKPPFFHTEE